MDSNRPSFLYRFVVPGVILAGGIAGAVALVALKPEVERRPPEVLVPLVRVEEVELVDRVLEVESQGTVSPRTQSQLVPEVSGRITWVSDALAVGGFFAEGQPLVRLDPFDYRQALVTARAELARAELRLAQEEAEARVARREWEDLGRGDGSPLTLREPQLAEARAAVEAAKANVERAERNLTRTEIRAPYAGRVRQESVDAGQFVTVGAPIATIYSVDAAEIRLPLPDSELQYLELPLTYRDGTTTSEGPRVELTADFAGERYFWEGRIVRTEGEIDPQTRMVHAIAAVKDPYGGGADSERPPLNVGMFVRARIEGKRVEDVAVLPRSALRPEDVVWIVEGGVLRYRDVTVLRRTEKEVLVSGGLEDGELVCVSPLDATTDGMRVRIASDEEKSL